MSVLKVIVDTGDNDSYSYEIRHLGDISYKRHGTCRWWYSDGRKGRADYYKGKSHGINMVWRGSEILIEEYYLYGEKVSKEEYRKHELIEELSRLKCEK